MEKKVAYKMATLHPLVISHALQYMHNVIGGNYPLLKYPNTILGWTDFDLAMTRNKDRKAGISRTLNIGKEEVDHKRDGKTSSDLTLEL
jgi:hypothetical protein